MGASPQGLFRSEDPAELQRFRNEALAVAQLAHPGIVQVYDYVDSGVLMLARMYERRLKGYATIGYAVE